MADGFERNIHCLLGLPFDSIDMAEAVSRVRLAVDRKQRCFLSTPNLNFLVACLQDEDFRASVVNSDLSLVDGMPLVWLSRLLQIPIRERVAGSSLFEELRNDSNARLSVYFFGGPDGAAESACKSLNGENKGLICAGFHSPGFGSIADMSTDQIVTRINASNADFLVVALGARKGQAWIKRNRHSLDVPVISHLGAVVNFVAGTVDRAPAWMQKFGLEWAWRVKEEPALLDRYLSDGLALLRLLTIRVLPHAFYQWRNAPDAQELATSCAESGKEGGEFVIRLNGSWTNRNLDPVRTSFSRAVQSDMNVKLDMSGVKYVDSAFVGLVMLLHGKLRERTMNLRMVSGGESVRRLMRYFCVEYLLAD